jgi:hypothetical protein
MLEPRAARDAAGDVIAAAVGIMFSVDVAILFNYCNLGIINLSALNYNN